MAQFHNNVARLYKKMWNVARRAKKLPTPGLDCLFHRDLILPQALFEDFSDLFLDYIYFTRFACVNVGLFAETDPAYILVCTDQPAHNKLREKQ